MYTLLLYCLMKWNKSDYYQWIETGSPIDDSIVELNISNGSKNPYKCL